MGVNVSARPDGSLVFVRHRGHDHTLLLLRDDGKPGFGRVYRLGLHEQAPLMHFAPFGSEVVVPDRRGFRPTLTLVPGVWECHAPGPHFLHVTVDDVIEVTRAAAFCALGAVQALQALDLDDAAVSLLAGDYDNAATQWIADRDRRRQKA